MLIVFAVFFQIKLTLYINTVPRLADKLFKMQFHISCEYAQKYMIFV